jgi:hypothetical protein
MLLNRAQVSVREGACCHQAGQDRRNFLVKDFGGYVWKKGHDKRFSLKVFGDIKFKNEDLLSFLQQHYFITIFKKISASTDKTYN